MHSFRSRQILFPSKIGFILSAHRLINIITLLTLWYTLNCYYYSSSTVVPKNGSRRPMSLMRTHTQQYARSEYHTQLAEMSSTKSSILEVLECTLFFLMTVIQLPRRKHRRSAVLEARPLCLPIGMVLVFGVVSTLRMRPHRDQTGV